MQGGVDEADRLDADAVKHVLRRAAHMLRPYRRQCVIALGMVIVWTGTTLAVAAKNVMSSVPTYVAIETAFTLTQWLIVGPLTAIAFAMHERRVSAA